MLSVKNTKNTKMRTLHDSFYWELMWAMVGHEYYTLDLVINKYWNYTGFNIKKSMPLFKAAKVVRQALLKVGCKNIGEIYKPELMELVPFHKDNFAAWRTNKFKIINIIPNNKEEQLAKFKLKKRNKNRAAITAQTETIVKSQKQKIPKDFKIVNSVEEAVEEANKLKENTTKRRNVEIFPKPKRQTRAYLAKSKTCELLLQKEFTDGEIADAIYTQFDKYEIDVDWVRRCLNRGNFKDYGYPAENGNIVEIAEKAKPEAKPKTVVKKKKSKLKFRKKK